MGRKPDKEHKFYFGFPVEVEEASRGTESKRGVALLLALFVTAMVMLFLAEMKLNTSVANQIAVGHHLSVKSEYIAKSGVNLANLLISADLALDLTLREARGGKSFPSDGPSDIWGMLNGIPIGGESLQMVAAMQESFDLSKVNDSGVLDQLKLFDGSFVLRVEDESAKINLNQCGVGRGTKCMDQLNRLLSCPAEREYLQRQKARPQEMVALVRDWVDENDRAEEVGGYSSEDELYSEYGGDQFPKNARFDSLEELKILPGWTDSVYQIFSPFLTVYPLPSVADKKDKWLINFNSANQALLGCLLPKSTQECAQSAVSFQEARTLEGDVAEVTALQNTIKDSFCESDPEVVKWFGFRSDLFRVKVDGIVEGQSKTLEAVVKRGMPDLIDQKDGYTAAYKYLYWKML